MTIRPNGMRDWRPRNSAQTFRTLLSFIRPHFGIMFLCIGIILIGRVCAIVPPASLRYLVDGILKGNSSVPILAIIALILGAAAIQAMLTWAQSRMLHRASILMITDIRRRLQRQALHLPLRTFQAVKTGALVGLVMEDVESVRNLAHTGMVNFFSAFLGALVAFAALTAISRLLAGVVLGLFIVHVMLTSRVMRRLKNLFTARFHLRAELVGRLNESFAGIGVVKAYSQESAEGALFEAKAEPHTKNRLETVRINAILSSTAVVPTALATAVLACIGSIQVRNREITVGGLVTFAALLPYLLAPILQIPDIVTEMSEAMAGFDRVLAMLEQDVECPSEGSHLTNIRGEIEFRNVKFGYINERNALDSISFRIAAGSVTAIVGPSGAGKSTIMLLLAGFYQPDAGSILIDGIDLKDVSLKSRRECMAMVMQDTFLFSGTLRENVALARPDASDAEIERACEMAGLQGFVQNHPLGYGAQVGERGASLSGGERQRVAIARAILANPSILILDEPTSNLDTECEATIQRNLQELIASRTTLIVSHRLNMIRSADEIIVLDHGRIVESGSHDELLRQGSRYASLSSAAVTSA